MSTLQNTFEQTLPLPNYDDIDNLMPYIDVVPVVERLMCIPPIELELVHEDGPIYYQPGLYWTEGTNFIDSKGKPVIYTKLLPKTEVERIEKLIEEHK